MGLRGNLFEWQQEQWQELDSGTSFTFNSIVSVNNKTTLVLGNNGAMLKITDEQIEFTQAEDGKSLINAVVVGKDIIAVSEVGIKTWSSEGK